ncbi:MAG: hypothetical protein KDK27_02495 [Leptospiraceae bacterium]|nr:hypothetical protein [Leptospiraceae bacterium]
MFRIDPTIGEREENRQAMINVATEMRKDASRYVRENLFRVKDKGGVITNFLNNAAVESAARTTSISCWIISRWEYAVLTNQTNLSLDEYYIQLLREGQISGKYAAEGRRAYGIDDLLSVDLQPGYENCKEQICMDEVLQSAQDYEVKLKTLFETKNLKYAIVHADTTNTGDPNHFFLIYRGEDGEFYSMDHGHKEGWRNEPLNWERVHSVYFDPDPDNPCSIREHGAPEWEVNLNPNCN